MEKLILGERERKKSGGKFAVIKNPAVYSELLCKFSELNVLAKDSFFNDHAILSRNPGTFTDLAEAGALFCFAHCCVLQSPESCLQNQPEVYSRLLVFCAEQGRTVDDIHPFFGLLLAAPKIAVPVLHCFLNDLFTQVLTPEASLLEAHSGILIALISSVYLLEDLLVLNPDLYKSKNLLSVLSRLLLVLSRTNTLYFSLPGLALPELQEIAVKPPSGAAEPEPTSSWGRPDCCKFALREGGFVRILLSTMLMLIKFDQFEDGTYSLAAMKFFVVRDKESKAKLKRCAEFSRVPESLGVKKPKKKAKYSFLDLLYAHPDVGKSNTNNKLHSGLMEGLAKKLGNEHTSVMAHPVGKACKLACMHQTSLFEAGSFQILYLASELIHLTHFELLGIRSYTQFPEEVSKVLESMSDPTSSLEFSPKMKALVDVIAAVLSPPLKVRDSTPELVLQSYFDQLPIRPDATFSSDLYSPLDESMSKSNNPLPEDLGFGSSPHANAPTCFNFFASLPLKLADAKSIEEKCRLLMQFTLCGAYMRLQPCLTFFTVDNFEMLDLAIKKRAERLVERCRTAKFAVPGQDYTKLAGCLDAYIEAEIATVPVHHEKLGISPHRKCFFRNRT